MLKELQVIINALERANQKGVYTLEESKTIADTLIAFKTQLTNDSYLTKPEEPTLVEIDE